MKTKIIEMIKTLAKIFKKDRNKTVQQFIDEVTDQFIWYLYDLITKNCDFAEKYLLAPGAKSHHHNHKYGLVEHSFTLSMELAVRVAEEKLDLTAKEVAFIGLAHDFCKTETYFFNEDGSISYDYDKYQHHGLKSVEICDEFGYNISNKVRVCIQLHMSKWVNPEDKIGMDNLKRRHKKVVEATQKSDMDGCKEYQEITQILEKEGD